MGDEPARRTGKDRDDLIRRQQEDPTRDLWQTRGNAQGHYVLTDVAGNMNVSVTADGYRERRTGFNVRMDLEQDFSLEPIPEPDYEIANVSRYDASIHVSDWLNFTWRALVIADRFEVSVRFQQGASKPRPTDTFGRPRVRRSRRPSSERPCGRFSSCRPA